GPGASTSVDAPVLRARPAELRVEGATRVANPTRKTSKYGTAQAFNRFSQSSDWSMGNVMLSELVACMRSTVATRRRRPNGRQSPIAVDRGPSRTPTLDCGQGDRREVMRQISISR